MNTCIRIEVTKHFSTPKLRLIFFFRPKLLGQVRTVTLTLLTTPLGRLSSCLGDRDEELREAKVSKLSLRFNTLSKLSVRFNNLFLFSEPFLSCLRVGSFLELF